MSAEKEGLLNQRSRLESQVTSLAQQLQDIRGEFRSAQQSAKGFEDRQNARIAQLSEDLEKSKKIEEELRRRLASAEPPAVTGSLRKISDAGEGSDSEPEKATAMLALAMQLHDQYVNKGKAQKAQLVAEGDVAKESMIEEGRKKYNALVGDAEEYSRHTREEADKYSQRIRQEADDYSSRTRAIAEQESTKQRTSADNYATTVRAEAQAYDKKVRGSADDYAKAVKDKLFNDTKTIEANLEDLKKFESNYKSRLKDFLVQLMSQISTADDYSSDSMKDSNPDFN